MRTDLAPDLFTVAGTALVFAHAGWHEGTRVTAGRKYVLRTDVMYRDA